MIKKLYIVRHGQTDYNKKGIVQGSGIDSSLNEQGRAQAELFYDSYKEIDFDIIYTSGLKRTSQSVYKFIEKGIKHQSHSGLNEISWGIEEGSVISNNSDSFFNQLASAWKSGDLDRKIKRGESPKEVQKRQQKVLDLIMKGKEENVLICMHGRALRIFLSLILDTELAAMDQYSHTNLCLYQLDYRNNKFALIQNNNVNHL